MEDLCQDSSVLDVLEMFGSHVARRVNHALAEDSDDEGLIGDILDLREKLQEKEDLIKALEEKLGERDTVKLELEAKLAVECEKFNQFRIESELRTAELKVNFDRQVAMYNDANQELVGKLSELRDKFKILEQEKMKSGETVEFLNKKIESVNDAMDKNSKDLIAAEGIMQEQQDFIDQMETKNELELRKLTSDNTRMKEEITKNEEEIKCLCDKIACDLRDKQDAIKKWTNLSDYVEKINTDLVGNLDGFVKNYKVTVPSSLKIKDGDKEEVKLEKNLNLMLHYVRETMEEFCASGSLHRHKKIHREKSQ